MLQNSLGHSVAHLENFKLFIFRLKPRCPPSMLFFDMKCLVSHHSPNNTDSGEGGMTPIMLKKVEK